MRLSEIKSLVDGTADAAYVLDPDGAIVAWNRAAEQLFGLNERQVLGKPCSETLHGIDECGRECSRECTILQRARDNEPLRNYDIKVRTGGREQWCNASVLILENDASTNSYTLHIIRPTDVQKRLEMAMRDFVAAETTLPQANVQELLAVKNSPTGETDLTRRELEVLRLLAAGHKTTEIAEKLFISRTTTNNHIQNLMKKLSAHTRLEAVRRAERAGLLL
jgi:PAS domain S-box-containing protein